MLESFFSPEPFLPECVTSRNFPNAGSVSTLEIMFASSLDIFRGGLFTFAKQIRTKGKPVIICGDLNTAPRACDQHPKAWIARKKKDDSEPLRITKRTSLPVKKGVQSHGRLCDAIDGIDIWEALRPTGHNRMTWFSTSHTKCEKKTNRLTDRPLHSRNGVVKERRTYGMIIYQCCWKRK